MRSRFLKVWSNSGLFIIPVIAIYLLLVNSNPVLADTPDMTDWNTYLGSSMGDYGQAITLDSSGNIYVTGFSGATWGSSPRHSFQSASDVFVAKLDSSGNLLWHTFLGGNWNDKAYSIALGSGSNPDIYIAGKSDGNWTPPSTLQPYQASSDGWVAKLNNNGDFQWVTFMGGTGSTDEECSGLTVDSNDNIYAAGSTESSWGSNIIRTYSGNSDAFVAKLDSSGNLIWNAFLGGSYYDVGTAITTGPDGNIYMGGTTRNWGTPQNPHTGSLDGCIVKLDSDGNLLWNTFLGGSQGDNLRSIIVDNNSDIFITGDSPCTWGAPVRAFSGNGNIFVAKVNSSGLPQWNTFLGGNSALTYGFQIAQENDGNLFVAGYGTSDFGSPQQAYSGNNDILVGRFNSAGDYQWHTFLGSTAHENASGLAVDNNGNAFIIANGQGTWGSPVRGYTAPSNDAIIVKLKDVADVPEIAVKGHGQEITSGASNPSTDYDTDFGNALIGSGSIEKTFTIKNAGGADLNLSSSPFKVELSEYTDFSISSQPASPVTAGSIALFNIKFDPASTGTKTVTATIVSDDTDEPTYTFTLEATGKAALTVSGISAEDKVYDGNTSAVLHTGSAFLEGVFEEDNVTLQTAAATGAFDTRNTGTGKTVTVSGLTIIGTDADFYILTQTTATAGITTRGLTVTATADNKTYDGTAEATVNLSDDRISGDSLTTGYASAVFNSKQAGTGKIVVVNGISLNGSDAGNYSLTSTSASTTASISTRKLKVDAGGINKTYDGTAEAAVNLSDDRISGDIFTVHYAGAGFNNPDVGNGKAVAVWGIFLDGTDAGNYTCNTYAETTADITPATPFFSNLSHPVIIPGTVETTLGGVISGNSPYPTGSVAITLNEVTQSASISGVDGRFSSVFNTSVLTIEGSPYTISYCYPGDGNYNSLSPDTSQRLTLSRVTAISVGGEIGTLNKPVLLVPWLTLFGLGIVVSRFLIRRFKR